MARSPVYAAVCAPPAPTRVIDTSSAPEMVRLARLATLARAVARSVSLKSIRPSSAKASVDLMAGASVMEGVFLARHRTRERCGAKLAGSLQDHDASGPGPRRFLT